MAKPSEDAEFDKENNKNGQLELDAAFAFPSEFPYEFDSFGIEPVESVTGSTETESSDEEDFFAGLTRRLSQASLLETRKQLSVPICNSDKAESVKKIQGLAGSPQSTLSGIETWSGRSNGSLDGSPNGTSRVPSPITTPFSAANDTWDVLSAAAGQVARLKLNNEASKFEFQNRGGVFGNLPTENRAASFFAYQTLSEFEYQKLRQEQVLKQQCGSVWGSQPKGCWSTRQRQSPVQNRVRNFGYGYENAKCSRPSPHPAWHPLQVKQQNQQLPRVGSGSRPVLQGGSIVKRGCGGTGVFLPRQYGAPPPESRKKTTCSPPVLLPAKVIHALNMNMDELNAHSQPRFSNALAVDYDALMARRNALLLQQRLRREEAAANYEIRLPQEWTY